jgi:glycosyltransferase involved in cell wall biosynthesis
MNLSLKNIILGLLLSVLLALYLSTAWILLSRFVLFPKPSVNNSLNNINAEKLILAAKVHDAAHINSIFNEHPTISSPPINPPLLTSSSSTNNNNKITPPSETLTTTTSSSPILTNLIPSLNNPNPNIKPLSPIEIYFQQHSTLPIVVLCYNRPQELGETLDSLLSIRYVKSTHILIAQDGSDEAVSQQAKTRNLKLALDVNNPALPGSNEGGKRIARHYGFSLERIFMEFPDTPAVIVIEDDMRFSPDFLEYFIFVGSILDKDPTLWCLSAWNDNGFAGLVKDIFALRRTVLFPGLGWLLTRKIWTEIKEKWPSDQWDWYVRAHFQKKELECVYPEIPRIFHAGKKGTFMDPNTHAKYFDHISHNTDSNIKWFGNPVAEQSRDLLRLISYNANLAKIINNGIHVDASQGEGFEDLVFRTSQDKPPGSKNKALILWYEADPDPRFEDRVKGFAQYFGIWHQLLRGSHESILEFYYRDVKIIAINTFRPRVTTSSWFTPYMHQTMFIDLKPNGLVPIEPMEFVVRASRGKRNNVGGR